MASDTPNEVASSVAPSTNSVLPPIRQPKPTIIHIADMVVLILGTISNAVSASLFSASKSFFSIFAPVTVIYMKIRKKTKSTAASMRPIFPSKHIIIKITDATRANGMSFSTVERKITIGAIAPESPTMSKVLKILEPTTLPTAKSGVPLSAEIRLTQNSGILVPIATMVSPITICGIFIRSATATAPSVRRSAPHNTMAMPAIMKIIFNSIYV